MVKLTVKFRREKEFKRFLNPNRGFAFTRGATLITGEEMKIEVLANAPTDSGRLKNSIRNEWFADKNEFTYKLIIDTKEQGSKVNYVWAVEGVDPSGNEITAIGRGKPGLRSIVNPSAKQREWAMENVPNYKGTDVIYWRSIKSGSMSYTNTPFVRPAVKNARSNLMPRLSEAVIKDMIQSVKSI